MLTDNLLLDDLGAASALNISLDDLSWLVATGQLLPVQICGKRQFVVADLKALITSYKAVQHRN